MLLPGNSLRRFVKVIMGLFIIVTLLVPVVSVIGQGESLAINSWLHSSDASGEVASVLSNGQQINEELTGIAVGEYEKKLSRQVAAMVALVPGVKWVEARVQMKSSSEDPWAALDSVWLDVGLTTAKPTTRERIGAEDRDASEKIEVEAEAVNPVKPVAPVEIIKPSDGTEPVKLDEGGIMDQIEPGESDQLINSSNRERIEEQIRDTVANFYGVSREKIQIEFF
jgi:stage III sporulation protein AF